MCWITSLSSGERFEDVIALLLLALAVPTASKMRIAEQASYDGTRVQ